MTAFHQIPKNTMHKNTKWTNALVESILADIKGGMTRDEVAAKHGVCRKIINRKITAYNYGELK